MTNEQEIVWSVFGAYLNDLKAYSTKPDRPTFKRLEEVRDRAIKALESQPCEDCISREDALEEACEFIEIGYNGKGIFRRLKELPSVTPQPKRGKWIGVDETHSICEKCEAIFEISSPNAEVNFCPSCGVLLESEMQEGGTGW